MQLSIVIATLEGCPFAQLDDPRFVRRLLDEATAAGHLTTLQVHVHKFEPQGVTAAAVLSESHIAIHTWPEEGNLFIDIATCSGDASALAAFDRVLALVPHERVKRQDIGYRGERWSPMERMAAVRAVG